MCIGLSRSSICCFLLLWYDVRSTSSHKVRSKHNRRSMVKKHNRDFKEICIFLPCSAVNCSLCSQKVLTSVGGTLEFLFQSAIFYYAGNVLTLHFDVILRLSPRLEGVQSCEAISQKLEDGSNVSRNVKQWRRASCRVSHGGAVGSFFFCFFLAAIFFLCVCSH